MLVRDSRSCRGSLHFYTKSKRNPQVHGLSMFFALISLHIFDLMPPYYTPDTSANHRWRKGAASKQGRLVCEPLAAGSGMGR